MHDKAIADTEEYQLPAGSSCTQDRGFQGFTIPEVTMIQPLKKPRNRVLSPEERIENRAINQERIRIEHSITTQGRREPPIGLVSVCDGRHTPHDSAAGSTG